MGYDDSLNDSSLDKRCFTGFNVHLSAEEVEPNRQRQARERI